MRGDVNVGRPTDLGLTGIAMTVLDYEAEAELFMTRRTNRSRPLRYRRFNTAAEALRFAIEDMPAALLSGSLLEVNGERFDGKCLLELYTSEAYPLPRGPARSLEAGLR